MRDSVLWKRVKGLGREATSAYDIDFPGVVAGDVGADKAGGSIDVAGGGVAGGVANAIVAAWRGLLFANRIPRLLAMLCTHMLA